MCSSVPGARLAIGLSTALALAACSTPVGVHPLDPRAAYRELTASALSAKRPSIITQNTLRARGLLAELEDDPEGTLRTLHDLVVSGRGDQPELFALAEISFLLGTRTGRREQYLASAVYAWAFLFPGQSHPSPGGFDPRTRMACDLYNRALAAAFLSEDGKHVDLHGGIQPLPFGELEIELDPGALRWAGRQLLDFLDLSRIEVRGLRNRYRLPGLGAPMAARTAVANGTAPGDLVGPTVRVPLTAVLHLGAARSQLGAPKLQGRLEVFSLDRTESFIVEDRPVALEIDSTGALAATLSSRAIWEHELWGFLGRAETGDELPLLRALAPHNRGRIPVVFVHGTASSPGRWADMVNDLWSSQSIRGRYEPWFFMYDTGNPIAYSGMMLREKLASAVTRIDPDAGDRCLRQMVVIGHSQGGLLTKMTAVETGDRLWAAISARPLGQLELSDKTRDLLQRAFFLKPLPFVQRVIFVATPHRGSYQALRNIAGWVTRFVRLPGRVTGVVRELSLNADSLRVAGSLGRVPTSIHNMREGNPFLMGLAAIPVVAGIPRHSIIPVRGEWPAQDANDGVVQYRSAHIDDADSELVVHSGHSTQAEPATIEEVRRILELHADTLAASGLRCSVDPVLAVN